MKPAARVQAAIDVLADIIERGRSASAAMTEWGRTHRFAGSGDRAAIANLVYDALRRRASAARLMASDSPRAVILGTLRLVSDLTPEAIAALADGSRHAPSVLTEDERAAVSRVLLPDAQPADVGDYPAWLDDDLRRTFCSDVIAQMQALCRRAPLDLRVNSLRTSRKPVLDCLAQHHPQPAPLSPVGIRLFPDAGSGRLPNIEVTDAFKRGWYEVQDEGSQIAAALAGARPGMAVADLCAGAGGKTLALAAAMDNRGTIHAYDSELARLRPMSERLTRAGVRNVAVLPAGDTRAVAALAGRMDVVLVDAPCSGSGTWRRHPDAKWRLTRAEVEQRLGQQRAVLDMAAPLVKPGGRIVYVTCSILCSENAEQVAAFLERKPEFAIVPAARAWTEAGLAPPAPASADGRSDTLQLTPHTHGTDGFFIAVLERC